MSNPISSFLAKKFAKSVNEKIDSSSNPSLIRAYGAMGIGGFLVFICAYRFLFYIRDAKNNILTLITLVFGLFIFFLGYALNIKIKSMTDDDKRNKKYIKR